MTAVGCEVSDYLHRRNQKQLERRERDIRAQQQRRGAAEQMGNHPATRAAVVVVVELFVPRVSNWEQKSFPTRGPKVLDLSLCTSVVVFIRIWVCFTCLLRDNILIHLEVSESLLSMFSDSSTECFQNLFWKFLKSFSGSFQRSFGGIFTDLFWKA